MSDRIIRVRALERNIDRYQRLLQTNLNEIELRFVRQRLSEDRFALAIFQAIGPSDGLSDLPRTNSLPDALQ